MPDEQYSNKLTAIIDYAFGDDINPEDRIDVFIGLLAKELPDINLEELIELTERAIEFNEHLKELGIADANMYKASALFPKSVQYASSNFIDLAIELKKTEDNKDILLQDLADAFCPNGEIRNNSPFKVELLRCLENAQQDMAKIDIKVPAIVKEPIDKANYTPAPKTIAIITDATIGKIFYGNAKNGEGIFFVKNFKDLKLSNDDREISLETNGIGAGEISTKLGLVPAMDIDIPLLRTFAKTALTVKTSNTDMVTKFYLPDFCKALEVNRKAGNLDRAESRKQILEKIRSFEGLWGRLPNSPNLSKVFSIININLETEELTVAMPFFNVVYAELEARHNNALEIEKKPFYFGQSKMLRSTVNKERDKEAIELAITLIKGISKRGTLSDDQIIELKKKHAFKKYQTPKDKPIGSTVTYKITCKGLLNECEPLKYAIAQTKARGNKLRKLQQAFKNMYAILKKHSLLYDYYADLNITPIIPTMTTLDTYITVTHKGKNHDFVNLFEEQKDDTVIDVTPDESAN